MKGEVGPGVVIQDGGGGGSPNIRPPAEKAKSNSLGSTWSSDFPTIVTFGEKKSLFCLIPQLLLL